METITLGRTGLKVTVAGLGCGGYSRIGIAKFGLDYAAGIVRSAFDAGVNFFDTATAYGTQTAVGKGLAGIGRDRYVLSTKFPYKSKTGIRSAADLLETLDESLRELNTDYVDIYHIHGVSAADYPLVRETLVPTMKQAKKAGKLRFMGITEIFGFDTAHDMLKMCLPDDIFDVIMVGYNMLNPSAAKWVLPLAIEKNVGVLCMFAVRSALSNPAQLKIDVGRILAHAQADPALVKDETVLDFLVQSGAAASIMEAAYRYCRHTKGISVVLTGTSSPTHLKDNLASIQKEPLPKDVLERLGKLFGNVDCISGQ